MKSNLGVGLERIKKRFEEARVFLKKFEKEKRESEISGHFCGRIGGEKFEAKFEQLVGEISKLVELLSKYQNCVTRTGMGLIFFHTLLFA